MATQGTVSASACAADVPRIFSNLAIEYGPGSSQGDTMAGAKSL